MGRRPQAQIESMPAVDGPELIPLIKDICDFTLDFNKPPTAKYIQEWAEEEYGYYINTDTAKALLAKGIKSAGWQDK